MRCGIHLEVIYVRSVRLRTLKPIANRVVFLVTGTDSTHRVVYSEIGVSGHVTTNLGQLTLGEVLRANLAAHELFAIPAVD